MIMLVVKGQNRRNVAMILWCSHIAYSLNPFARPPYLHHFFLTSDHTVDKHYRSRINKDPDHRFISSISLTLTHIPLSPFQVTLFM